MMAQLSHSTPLGSPLSSIIGVRCAGFRAVNAAMDSGKPTLINAVIDPAAGSESGRIGNLNPQSKLKKK